MVSSSQAAATEAPRHRVVIVGGGFGGLHTAKHLSKSGYDVTLLDKRNFQLFQPLLYQVATSPLATSPFRSVWCCARPPTSPV